MRAHPNNWNQDEPMEPGDFPAYLDDENDDGGGYLKEVDKLRSRLFDEGE